MEASLDHTWVEPLTGLHWRGRLSTLNILVLSAAFNTKIIIFSFFTIFLPRMYTILELLCPSVRVPRAKGRLPALSANISLAWKWMTVTNVLQYWINYDLKKFCKFCLVNNALYYLPDGFHKNSRILNYVTWGIIYSHRQKKVS